MFLVRGYFITRISLQIMLWFHSFFVCLFVFWFCIHDSLPNFNFFLFIYGSQTTTAGKIVRKTSNIKSILPFKFQSEFLSYAFVQVCECKMYINIMSVII